MKHYLLLLLFIYSLKAFSQPENPIFEHLNIESGLSNNYIKCLHQDKLGFIWIGTIDGLNRYDGYSFKIFRNQSNDTSSIDQDLIKGFAQDKAGNIYVITDQCINKYLINTGIFVRYPINRINKNKSNIGNLESCFMDENDNLWLGTDLSGVFKFNIATYAIQELSIIKTLGRITHIFIDKQNNLWYRSSDNKGVYQFDLKKNKLTHHYKKRIQNIEFVLGSCNWVFHDKFNDYILASFYPNKVFNFTTNQVNYLIHQNDTLITGTQIQDFAGNYWHTLVTTKDGLLFENVSNHQTKLYTNEIGNPHSLSTTAGLNSLFIDATGCLWIGSENAGLNKLNTLSKKFTNYQQFNQNSETFNNINVNEITCDKEGNLWIGTSTCGIINFDPNHPDSYKIYSKNNDKSQNLTGNVFLTMVSDRNDNVWMGGNGAVNYYNKKTKTFNRYRPDSNPALNSWIAWSLFEDSRGFIWVGLYGGLAKYDQNKNTFTHFMGAQTPCLSGMFNCIREDNEGNLWFASSGGLIYSEKGTDKFTNIPLTDDNIYICVKSLFIDDQNIWLCTEQKGLIKMDIKNKKILKIYKEKDGLPNNNICGILKDQKGNLWVSTFRGLSKFNFTNETFRNYDINDGLQSNQFNYNSCYKMPNGEMYFGSINGFIRFHPDSITDNAYLPKVVLTDLKIFNKSVLVGDTINSKVILKQSIETTKELILSYKETVFSLEFSALHYSAPKKNQFAYIMEGLETVWNKTDYSRRYVSYSNLDPGTYKFRVKATNNDGIWCKPEDEVFLKITVTPPFWKTWWFRLSLIIIIGLSILSYYKYKTYEIKRKNEELERKVVERTNEVMQQKEELQQQAEELEATNEELIAQSDALREANDELISSKDEIVKSKDEIEKSFKISQVISEFGQRVTSTFDLESINEIVYGYICSIMPIDAFGIGLYNAPKNEIEYIGFIEEGQKIESFTKSLNTKNSLSAWCFNNQKVVFINDIFTEFNHYIPSLPNKQTYKQPLSLIHLPLSTNERKLGIIVVNSFMKNTYTNNNLVHLQSLASYITIALDNAEAYKTVNAQKEKLLELDNFKEAMTGMIVHDLKNPLNAIIGLSSMNPEDEMMQMVNSAGNQMLNLVLNILDVQKFENTSVKLNLSVASLYQLAEEACNQVSLLIKQKRQSLLNNISPQTIVRTDNEIIVRVFVNMLTNAIKYTLNEGKIKIDQIAIINNLSDISESEHFPPALKTKPDIHIPCCLICVSDNGQGIPSDKLHLVFEKFGQVEAKKSGGVRSTGLGMTFCKMVVEAHGGYIWITSEVGKGTNFYFTLPFFKSDQSIQVSNSTNLILIEKKSCNPLYDAFHIKEDGSCYHLKVNEDYKGSHELKILVADDDKYSIDVIKNCLSAWGKTFLLFAVVNGKDAIEVAQLIIPDIIMLDWEMPELDGLSALKEIKTIPGLEKIPIAMVTSRSGNSHIQSAFEAGASEYIKKPIDKTEALFRIQTLANLSNLIKLSSLPSPKTV